MGPLGQPLVRRYWLPGDLGSGPVRPWEDKPRHRHPCSMQAGTGQKEGPAVEEIGEGVGAPLEG